MARMMTEKELFFFHIYLVAKVHGLAVLIDHESQTVTYEGKSSIDVQFALIDLKVSWPKFREAFFLQPIN